MSDPSTDFGDFTGAIGKVKVAPRHRDEMGVEAPDPAWVMDRMRVLEHQRQRDGVDRARLEAYVASLVGRIAEMEAARGAGR